MSKISMKAARVNSRLTQTDMADLLGVTKDTVLKWENGKSKIGIPQFTMYCSVCKMKTDEIFLPVESTKSR